MMHYYSRSYVYALGAYVHSVPFAIKMMMIRLITHQGYSHVKLLFRVVVLIGYIKCYFVHSKLTKYVSAVYINK